LTQVDADQWSLILSALGFSRSPYTAENTAQGAQARIATSNPEALTAVHEFLRFQIKDHRTGDPLTVQANP
jgi:hypothetical protein